MHPLHDYVAQQLAEKLKARRIVVWYDPKCELAPFVAELRGDTLKGNELSGVTLAGVEAKLAEYNGSFFELRTVVEPVVCEDDPVPVLIYVPGRNLSTRLRHPLREFTEVPERRCLGCCSARRRSRAC